MHPVYAELIDYPDYPACTMRLNLRSVRPAIAKSGLFILNIKAGFGGW